MAWSVPHLIHIPWAHSSPQPKQHLDQFSRFAQLTAECPYNTTVSVLAARYSACDARCECVCTMQVNRKYPASLNVCALCRWTGNPRPHWCDYSKTSWAEACVQNPQVVQSEEGGRRASVRREATAACQGRLCVLLTVQAQHLIGSVQHHKAAETRWRAVTLPRCKTRWNL